jgi:DNA-binding MarR family transcriptional regulator
MPDVEDLLNEVRLLWHRLLQVGEQVHAREPVTLGMRAVLEHLAREGPATVPDIARARYVTRQHIQMLVNGLVEREQVQLHSNPAHKRSPLIRLTLKGERTIKRMMAKERRLFEGNFGMSTADLQRAAETLRAVRAGLERAPR